MSAPIGPPDDLWCGACRFWESGQMLDPDDGLRLGTCQRHAPRPYVQQWGADGSVLDGVTADRRWPQTVSSDWCGEFLRRAGA